MSTDRILQQLDRLYCLVEQHNSILTDLETDLPHHENTISNLRQQFEAHIDFLLVNLESYTTLQQIIYISPALFNNILHISSPRHTSCPPLLQFLRNPHQPLGDTRAQDTTHSTPSFSPTGLTASNRQTVSPTTFEDRIFGRRSKLSQSLANNMAPGHSKLTIHPWLDNPISNRIRYPQWRIYLYNAAQKLCTGLDPTGAYCLVARDADWDVHPKNVIPSRPPTPGGTQHPATIRARPVIAMPAFYTRAATVYEREI